MSKLSLSVYLNAYSDGQPSNSPGMNNFKWNRDINSMLVENPINQANTIAPGETRALFNGTRTLAQDGTTQYSISLKPLTTNTYVLANVAGTAPNFRVPRVTGADNTTQVTVVVNGPIVTFSSTGGTAFNLSSTVVGDQVAIGSNFNVLNQGIFTIIAKTTTSFTVEILTGTNEGPITLSAASQIQICSAAGVQVGDMLVISGGFSPATQGSYEVAAVYANSLEFIATGLLPIESNIQTQAIALYSDAKTLVYIESDSAVHVILNGVDIGQIEPFTINSGLIPSVGQKVIPGIFMLKSTIYSLSVLNSGLNPANVYFAAVE